MTEFVKGDWVEFIQDRGQFIKGSRTRVLSFDRGWNEVIVGDSFYTVRTIPKNLKKCQAPAVGDYVIPNFIFRVPTFWKDTPYVPRRVTHILNDSKIVIDGGPIIGTHLVYVSFVNIKTYKPPPEPKFKVGDKVIVPEEHEKALQQILGNALFYPIQNQEFTIINSNWNLETNDYSYTYRTSSGYIAGPVNGLEKYLKLKPKDWKPREIPLNLDELSVSNIHLTMPSFGSCCGFRGLYGFYCLHPGYETTKGVLTGSYISGRPIPPNIRITPEIFKAAIRNHVKSHDATGVIFAILATSQIPLYGPLLEECGFTKIKEYPNLNHGTNHMNAMYGYFCHEQREAKKVVEKKRTFG